MRGERRAIVIIGAGIGGLTAALALAAAGFRVVIVERSPHLSAAGAGIQISPNASRILAGLGLDAALTAAALEPEAIEVRSGISGGLITAIPLGGFRARYGFPYRVIHRADLQTILARTVAANPDIDLALGATVPQVLPQPDGFLVRVQKPKGIDVVPAVGIVAADGVWSTFRERIAGSAQPAQTGRTAWRAVVAADIARDLVPMNRTGLWLGRDAHLVHYPVSRGAAVNFVAIVEEASDKKGWSTVGDRAELASRFKEWPAAARKLLAAPLAWQKFAILSVNPAAAWCDGRVALLGDAAHAMAPYLAQGAAMAMEDAAVLGDALTETSDIPAAFREYEAARKPRVARVAKASAATGGQYHATGLMAFARDTALRLAGPRLVLGRNDWIYDWQPPERAPAI